MKGDVQQQITWTASGVLLEVLHRLYYDLLCFKKRNSSRTYVNVIISTFTIIFIGTGSVQLFSPDVRETH
jgi:hypothetical protein